MQTWKGTAERIFYASTASTSSSIHQIAVEHRKQQQHQNTTKLLPPPPKRRREPRVSTSRSREPNKSISTGPEERFQRINKLLEKVLHEAEQIPAVTTRAEHQCNEKEKILDEKKQEPSRATNNCPDGFIRTTQTISGHSLHKVPDRQRDPADTRASRSSSLKWTSRCQPHK